MKSSDHTVLMELDIQQLAIIADALSHSLETGGHCDDCLTQAENMMEGIRTLMVQCEMAEMEEDEVRKYGEL